MTTTIFGTLEKLGLTSLATRALFNKKTRDMSELSVWRDAVSGVIYIDDFYTGDSTYIEGSYRASEAKNIDILALDFERSRDASRRFKSNLKFIAGKKIGDFGCGNGDFLRLVQPYCKSVVGIELQKNCVQELNSQGISCVEELAKIEDESLDVLVSFHVIEHLPRPLEVLAELKKKLVSGGMMLIEVPHANDFLLSRAQCEEFKEFTLWSQHLILHTRESLKRMLEHVGLTDVLIEGVQRYPLSNHLNWLANGKDGGHRSSFAVLDSDILHDAYQSALASTDSTDTLVAIARVPSFK